jgi:FMN reductase (NADPH)
MAGQQQQGHQSEIASLRAQLAAREAEIAHLRVSAAARAEPQGISMVEFLAARRTVRRFTSDPVPQADIRRAVQAGQRASTSSWIQAFTLMQISDPELRKKLHAIEGVGTQSQNVEASELFVLCGDSRRHQLIAAQEGTDYSPNFETFLLGVIDASLFIERMSAALEAMGYGICYVGALRNHLPDVDALLKLPLGVFPLFAMSVGVPDGPSAPTVWRPDDPELRPRLPVDAVLMQDSYISDEAMLEQIALADDEAAAYYKDRPTGLVGDPRSVAGRSASDPAVRRTWSGLGGFPGKAMLSKFGSPARTHLLDLYASKGANFESELQNIPNAIPNVVTALRTHKEEQEAEAAVAADDVQHVVSKL